MSAVRVLLLIESLAPEAGTENQVMELVRRADRSQVEFFIACLEDGARLQSLAPYATPLVYPVRSTRSLTYLQQLLRLRKDIRRLSIDVVHTFMVRATIFGVLGAAGSKAKAIVTSRRNMGYWYTPGLLRMFKLLNRFTTRVLANSQGARAEAIRAEGLPPDRVDVIYSGVDLNCFHRSPDPALRARLGIPPLAPVVGIVANYRPVKNLPLFLQAARIVSEQVPTVAFLLIGRGPEHANLERLARELGISDHVYFSSSQDGVAAFLPLFQVACLTSHSEGFSNAVLEYMAVGLPVVATNVGGLAEAVEQEVTGLLVPPGNVEALAHAIAGLLLDPVRCAEMGRAGRQRCEQFALPRIVRQHELYYLRLAAQTP